MTVNMVRILIVSLIWSDTFATYNSLIELMVLRMTQQNQSIAIYHHRPFLYISHPLCPSPCAGENLLCSSHAKNVCADIISFPGRIS